MVKPAYKQPDMKDVGRINPEIRAKVERISASERAVNALTAAVDEGHFMNRSRINSWALGWLKSERYPVLTPVLLFEV